MLTTIVCLNEIYFRSARHPFDSMKFLLENGADIHAVTGDAGNILHHIFTIDGIDDIELVALLFKYGVDTTVADKDGDTPMVFLARYTRLVNTAEFILEHDLFSSSPFQIEYALKAISSWIDSEPESKKAIKRLLESWKGPEGKKKREAVAKRLGKELDKNDYSWPSTWWEQFEFEKLREMTTGERSFDGLPITPHET